jgi:hypothetical protein
MFHQVLSPTSLSVIVRSNFASFAFVRNCYHPYKILKSYAPFKIVFKIVCDCLFSQSCIINHVTPSAELFGVIIYLTVTINLTFFLTFNVIVVFVFTIIQNINLLCSKCNFNFVNVFILVSDVEFV